MKTKPELTADQLAAIVAFAASNGRDWKRKLNDAWLNGRDANEPNGHFLRQVRNTLGPQWLVGFKLPAMETKPKSTYGERAACRYCNQDIEFHGRKFGWIDRGSDRTCRPYIDRAKGEVVKPKTKHAPYRPE